MNAEGIWRLFCETGDPALFLVYRELERERRIAEMNKDDDRTQKLTGIVSDIRIN